MKTRKLLLRRWFVLVLASLMLVAAAAVPAFAAQTESTASGTITYYRNWEEYTKANEPAYEDGTWKFHDIKDAIEQVMDAGQAAVEAGDTETARQCGSDAYYGFYDLAFENATNMYISGSRVKQMELLFGQLRTYGANGDASGYEETVSTLKEDLEEDANQLDGEDLDGESSSGGSNASSSSGDTQAASSSSSQTMSATMLVFFGTFFDILREGFEAIIVVGAIIAYLQVQVKNGSMTKRKALYPVYFGALLGIVCSFIMAAILNAVRNSSASQELVEGITALFAVCVLFYTCNWMLSKSETEAWTAYIKDKTETGSKNGSIFALALASFLAVFREGAEAVLFLQPYLREDETRGGVIAGLIVAAIALVIIYLLIHLLSVKLPMRLFFNATSILMAVMCVCFLGAGISELIEAEVISASPASWLSWIPLNNSVLDVLGIYPYVETIVPQIILAIVLIILFHIGFKKNRAIRKEAEAKKAEQEAKAAAEKKAKEDAAFREKVRAIVLEVLEEKQGGTAAKKQ